MCVRACARALLLSTTDARRNKTHARRLSTAQSANHTRLSVRASAKRTWKKKFLTLFLSTLCVQVSSPLGICAAREKKSAGQRKRKKNNPKSERREAEGERDARRLGPRRVSVVGQQTIPGTEQAHWLPKSANPPPLLSALPLFLS